MLGYIGGGLHDGLLVLRDNRGVGLHVDSPSFSIKKCAINVLDTMRRILVGQQSNLRAQI